MLLSNGIGVGISHQVYRGLSSNTSSSGLLFSWNVPSSLALPIGASFGRAGIAYVQDYQGKYWSAAADVLRIRGARIVDSGGGELAYYGTDGAGDPIDPTTISAKIEASLINDALNSRTLSSFTGATRTTNLVGIDGASNAATTVTDASAAALEEATLVIGETLTPCVVTFYLKKTSGATVFPEFFLYTGTTATSSLVQVNTNTGAIATRAGALLQGQVVSDSASWWKVGLWVSSVYVVSFRVRPAATTSLGSVDVALTGSIGIDGFMLVKDVSFSTVMNSSPIFTTTVPVTRAADSLDLSECAGYQADNESRFTYSNGSTADVDDWNGVLTLNKKYRNIQVYAPGTRP